MKRLSCLGIALLLLSGCNENVSTKADSFPIETMIPNIGEVETSVDTFVNQVKETAKEKEENIAKATEEEKETEDNEVATTTTTKSSESSESKSTSSNSSQSTSMNTNRSTSKSTSTNTTNKSTTTSKSTQSSTNSKTDSSTKKDNTASKKEEPYIVRGSIGNSGKVFNTKDEAIEYGNYEILYNENGKWFSCGYDGYTIDYSDGSQKWTIDFYDPDN